MPNKKLKIKASNLKTAKFFSLTNNKITLILVLILIALSLILKLYLFNPLSFDSIKVPNQPVDQKIQPKPLTHISIPKAKIDLAIEITSIKDGVWQISKNGASHLENSSLPGTEGNIIIYSHNTKDRFAKLLTLEMGDQIILTDQDGQTFIYKVYESQVVSPKQVDVLNENNGQTLILYTCTGLLDSKRFIVKASPVI